MNKDSYSSARETIEEMRGILLETDSKLKMETNKNNRKNLKAKKEAFSVFISSMTSVINSTSSYYPSHSSSSSSLYTNESERVYQIINERGRQMMEYEDFQFPSFCRKNRIAFTRKAKNFKEDRNLQDLCAFLCGFFVVTIPFVGVLCHYGLPDKISIASDKMLVKGVNPKELETKCLKKNRFPTQKSCQQMGAKDPLMVNINTEVYSSPRQY
eukprot:TRINITY_DN336_c0_g1_i1.p2 TRINITY_DN336_c0_g1~~TRINITY_DN336_c0_g1_i1.p2  ORF type:complete len:213 (-),score=80.06 TRINITY_DN336_c0_g1_i1:68-706(-)